MTVDYVKLIKEQEEANAELYNRMEGDRKLVELDAYQMVDRNNKPIPNIVNVTLSLPARFAAHVESALGNTEEQIAVESEDKKVNTAYIEDFVHSCFLQVNGQRRRQGKFPLNPFFDQQLCRRGRAAARCISYLTKEGLVIDVEPWDTRFLKYNMGTDGLEWAAYTITQTRSEIESEPWARKIGYVLTGKKAEVIEIWNKEENIIQVDGKEVYREPHPYRFTPVVLEVVTLGSMTMEAESRKSWGESIFWLMRGVMPEMNRLVSIMQTLNFLSIKHPGQWESEAGEQKEPPKYEEVISPGTITTAEPGRGFKPIDFGDATRAAQIAYAKIVQELQESGITDIDIGNPQQPFSAVALIEIGESRDQVYRPRMRSKASLNKSIVEMLIEEALTVAGGAIEVGGRGHKKTFDISKLEGEYDIEFNYFPKSPAIDIARISMASQAAQWYDKRTVRAKILQDTDPEMTNRKKLQEEAIMESVLLRKREQVKALIELDEHEAARILAQEIGLTAQQLLAGQLPMQGGGAPPAPPQESLLPLLGGVGGRLSSAKRASQLQQMPKGEE